MNLNEVLRAPWLAVGRPILKAAGFEIARGAQPSVDGALHAAHDEVRNAKLATLMAEHAIAGEKLVRLISVSARERGELAAWIQAKRRHSNTLPEGFPGIADDSELPPFTASTPTSLGAVELGRGLAAAFTAVRTYQDRVEISADKLIPGANEGYEKIYATKQVFWQTFDSIWLVPGRNYVALISDLPLKVPSGFTRASQQFLEAQVRQVLNRHVRCVNIWTAVEGLYRAEEGRLVDHGFVNNAEAVKSHTARRGGSSLRDDPYDVAGAEAVGEDLRTYRVAIAWKRGPDGGVTSRPEVSLPGTSRELHKNSLDHFIFRNGLNSGDLEFVVSKVLAHI